MFLAAGCACCAAYALKLPAAAAASDEAQRHLAAARDDLTQYLKLAEVVQPVAGKKPVSRIGGSSIVLPGSYGPGPGSAPGAQPAWGPAAPVSRPS